MLILGIDPGKTTGVALLDWDCSESRIPMPTMMGGFWQVEFENFPRWLDGFISMVDKPDLIVYEKFTISPRTLQNSRQMEPMYVIGMVIYAAALAGIPTREQTAASAKTAWPNDRLQGWYVKGTHAKDAIRHALLATHSPDVYRLCTDTDKKEP